MLEMLGHFAEGRKHIHTQLPSSWWFGARWLGSQGVVFHLPNIRTRDMNPNPNIAITNWREAEHASFCQRPSPENSPPGSPPFFMFVFPLFLGVNRWFSANQAKHVVFHWLGPLGFPLPGSPVAIIFQPLSPNYGLVVGKVAGKKWLLGFPLTWVFAGVLIPAKP